MLKLKLVPAGDGGNTASEYRIRPRNIRYEVCSWSSKKGLCQIFHIKCRYQIAFIILLPLETNTNLLDFKLEFISKHVGSDTTIGRNGSRELITERHDAIQIIKLLTRYLSPINKTNGMNIC